MKNAVRRYNADMITLYPSDTMNAAALTERPSSGSVTIKKKNIPACHASKEALKRGTFEYITIFMVWV